jgi:hypothetical protein
LRAIKSNTDRCRSGCVIRAATSICRSPVAQALPTPQSSGEQARFQLSFEAWKGGDLALTYYGGLDATQLSSATPIWIAMA